MLIRHPSGDVEWWYLHESGLLERRSPRQRFQSVINKYLVFEALGIDRDLPRKEV